MGWTNETQVSSVSFRCGHCGWDVASSRGFYTTESNQSKAYICPHCNELQMMFADGDQIPSSLPGVSVKSLPTDVESAYEEARRCYSAGAYTGSVLLSRKLLMNLAVAHGAAEGKTFAHYIDFLEEKHFIPPNGKGWVNHIREKGNDATHQIAIMTKDDAEDLIAFSQGLLQFIYEFPARVPKPR